MKSYVQVGERRCLWRWTRNDAWRKPGVILVSWNAGNGCRSLSLQRDWVYRGPAQHYEYIWGMLIRQDVRQHRQAPTRCKEARALARSHIKYAHTHVDRPEGVL